ncbi:MAG: AzlC family ABC transporter permease [Alphaproteobacteria bacterium]
MATSTPITAPQKEFLSGAVEIIPLALGVAIYGLAFGLLASQASMDGLQVGVMGGIVFAGASQIVAAERLVAGAGAFIAIVAGAALNLRLLLITASIRDIYAGRPFWQVVLGAHLTTDENWALILSKRSTGRQVGYWYLIGGGLTLAVVWIVATVAGFYVAHTLPEPRALGMDFAFTAAFIAIARTMWKGAHDLAPWITSFAVVALSIGTGVLDVSFAMVLGGISGAAVAGVLHHE